MCNFFFNEFQIVFGHNVRKFFERYLRSPTQYPPCLTGVALQEINFGRPEIGGVDFNQRLATLSINALLLESLTLPYDIHSQVRPNFFGELSHRMSFSRCNDKIIRFLLLENPPYRLHVILRIAPVPFCVEIAQLQDRLNSKFNSRETHRYLARNKRNSAPLGFMVEQNSVGSKDAVPFAITLGNIECKSF